MRADRNSRRRRHVERRRIVTWSGRFGLVALMAAVLCGCTPPGPRALLDGQRLLEEGKPALAADRLKVATSLLKTNAVAWNYLGLAFHQSGQPIEAEKAYLQALALDHDLAETRYNLACLRLQQNKLELARSDLTTFTLRNPTSPDGLTKLGTVQLRLRDFAGAEKSFSDSLKLRPNDPETLVGLGMARGQRGRWNEAAQLFDSALKQQPDYGPALLNLAIVAQQNQRDPNLALQRYRQYLALRPPPENAPAVREVAARLEQELAAPRPAAPVSHSPVAPVPGPKPSPPSNAPPAALAKAPLQPGKSVPPRVDTLPTPPTEQARTQGGASKAPAARPEPKPTPEQATVAAAAEKPTSISVPSRTNASVPPVMEQVQLGDEPTVKAGGEVSLPAANVPAAPSTSQAAPASKPVEAKAKKRNFLQRMNPLNLLDSKSEPGTEAGKTTSANPPMQVQTALDPELAKLNSPRYAYKKAAIVTRGNRQEAERAFARGVQAHRNERYGEAIQAYRQAQQADPSYYDAHFNLGLAAAASGNSPLALSAYEDALGIQPRSLDARFNFALGLKQAGYLVDAVLEFERILSFYPNESRSHLVLGNVYAQQLQNPAKARAHYRKVLETDPQNAQAAAIRYWLAEHP